jgi:uncharacterized protein YbcC (UPF0753/DUF2309 family)
MHAHATIDAPAHAGTGPADRLARLQSLIEHAAHLLPSQGPITKFVHHNTLHAFEDLPFDQAVLYGGATFGCHPYLPEEQYRQLLESGRIRPADLSAVLMEELADEADLLIGFLGTRHHLREAMLAQPLRLGPDAELRWLIAETDVLWKFPSGTPASVRGRMIAETRHWVMRDLRNGSAADDHRLRDMLTGLMDQFGRSHIEDWNESTWEAFALHLLWRICHQGVHGLKRFAEPAPHATRHRDLLLQASGEDTDQLVHDVLIRFCAAFLDQGFAAWTLPQRNHGFFRSFLALYRDGRPVQGWLKGLPAELRRIEAAGLTPLEIIDESLLQLGVVADREQFLIETLLALRGWAGMLWQMETNAEWAVHPAPHGTLVEYTAVRLILERLAAAHVAQHALDAPVNLPELRSTLRHRLPHAQRVSVEQRAFLVFQLARGRGWTPADLHKLSKGEWSKMVAEIELFSGPERRRIYHLAYERRYRRQTLDAVLAHDRRRPAPDVHPRFQVVCCIDEREESFRRHLEEVAPECETLGAAGFFGVAIYYRGAADAHYVPLCPPVIQPQHYVQEEVVYSLEASHRRRAERRRALGRVSHRLHLGSRTVVGGVMTAVLGSLASFPLVARVLLPRLTARLRRRFGSFVQPPPVTQLQIERTADPPAPENGHHGYRLEEMAAVVKKLLEDIGLPRRLARLVMIVGHGSSSLNNPHEAAHDCGACGGGRGGPNARAFAAMANDPRVREMLAQQDLQIPDHTHFVGAYHNTCDDGMTYYDLDRLPVSHRDEFERVRQAFDEARRRSAHERCRRFESAELALDPEAALRHVETRAEDLSQTRPEYGHATNALCFVGRRFRTRGLFCDRRAFLTSYDAGQDDDAHNILLRILQAVIPVCAGISLEYYFSFVDATGYGCGTKLPHNITSLLGVMDGAASDLRPGLPWQMVEIHEPVRILFMIETTPQAMLSILDRNQTIGQLVRNEWVQLATLDPDSPAVHVYRDGRFLPYQAESTALPVARTSADWYRGWRDHLGFATIDASMSPAKPSTKRQGAPPERDAP